MFTIRLIYITDYHTLMVQNSFCREGLRSLLIFIGKNLQKIKIKHARHFLPFLAISCYSCSSFTRSSSYHHSITIPNYSDKNEWCLDQTFHHLKHYTYRVAIISLGLKVTRCEHDSGLKSEKHWSRTLLGLTITLQTQLFVHWLHLEDGVQQYKYSC